MITLTLIRHAPTQWNEDGRLQGHTDIPLSGTGEALARKWRLPAELKNTRWFCSPLTRTRQTAEILGLTPDMDDRLLEMNWGNWDGKTLRELRSALGAIMMENEKKGLDFRPDGGESPREVQERIKPWLREIAELNNPAGAITHKGVIRAITTLATGWDMCGKDKNKITPSTYRQFNVDCDGNPHLITPDRSLPEEHTE